jgi:hypothetical protein
MHCAAVHATKLEYNTLNTSIRSHIASLNNFVTIKMFFTFAVRGDIKPLKASSQDAEFKKAVFYSLFVFIALPSKIHNNNSLCIATTALTIQ